MLQPYSVLGTFWFHILRNGRNKKDTLNIGQNSQESIMQPKPIYKPNNVPISLVKFKIQNKNIRK